jgi:hypothetical protein
VRKMKLPGKSERVEIAISYREIEGFPANRLSGSILEFLRARGMDCDRPMTRRDDPHRGQIIYTGWSEVVNEL